MSEMIQKSIIALADSPLTTKVVILTGAGSWGARLLDVMPDIISLAGAVVAILAGGALWVRHRKAGKSEDARRKLDQTRTKGAEMQNIHDAKMHEHSAKMRDIELERVQLELDRYKAETN